MISRNRLKIEESLNRVLARLDYQPLFGKMSPHSSPERASGRIKDRTRETAEIESRFSQDRRPFMIDYLNEGPKEQVSMGAPGHAPQEFPFPGFSSDSLMGHLMPANLEKKNICPDHFPDFHLEGLLII